MKSNVKFHVKTNREDSFHAIKKIFTKNFVTGGTIDFQSNIFQYFQGFQ